MFKKQLNMLLLLCMLTTLFSSGIKVQASESGSSANSNDIQTEFFVSPSGSDTNDGSNDHPFATLQAARDAVRLINSHMTGDIIVYVASGNYYVNNTISFDERDSGTNGHRVIYANKDGLGTAKFIGGNKVTSAWSQVTRTGVDADLPAGAAGSVYKTFVGTGINFNTLYVNDSRAIMARTKNLTVDPRFPAASATYMRSAGGGISTLNYNSGDIDSESMTGLLNAQTRGELDAQVYMWDGGYWDWMTDTIPIASVNTSTRTINYKTDPNNRAAYRPKYATRSDARYFLQGNLGFLDQPGEYYFNKKTGYLYYYPVTGSGNISNQDIVIPAVEKIIDIKGASRTSMVSHITFSGLEFKDTNFPDYYAYAWNWGDAGDGLGYYPPEAAGSTQPSYAEQSERVEFQVGIITLSNTNNITITNTHIKNAGMFGIELYLANQYTNITNSLIEYTGHGGINLEGGYPGVGGDANGDGYSRDNKITNTIIHDIGQLVGQTSGVTINNSGYNTLSHLEIYNTPRRGIFITAGVSRNGGTPFPNGDKNFNIMTDMYSHHNTFEYIYLHDSQQDGGDDGAFFACYLYKGGSNYKPNYINQMLIDNVGANPSMRDIAPNGMNLDMGASGFVISNLKIVNPQHFNAEVETTTNNGDRISYTNTNIDFGTHTNQLSTFNDSLMDYANIGVGGDFPSIYKPARITFQEPADIYFKDDFENGLDLSKWVYRGTKPRITTEWMSEGVFNGKKALKIDSDSAVTGLKPVLNRDLGRSLNKIVTVKLFDRQNENQAPYTSGVSISTTVKSLARVDNGVHAVGLGLDTTIDRNYYVILDGSTETATSIPRTYGWHELKWDYTSGTDVKLYMDGVQVQTLSSITNFNRVELGSDDGKGVSYYDQLYMYGGTTAPQVPTLPIPPVNLAQSATITASSYPVNDQKYAPQSVADDIIGAWGSGEWASNGEANPWIQLNWSSSQTINGIFLYDRPNTSDWSQGGTLTFSDGSSVIVTGIPNDGTVKEVSFDAKDVTWVKFQVTGSTGNNGLSEFQVYKTATSLTVPNGLTANASSSSQMDVTWNAVDGATGYDLEADGGVINNVTSPYAHTGLEGTSTHSYKVRAKDASGITLWSSPVKGVTPAQTLGKFEAENYQSMSGIQTESSSEGGRNVSYIDAGDWMEYVVNVPAEGIYTVKYRVAGNTTGEVQFMVNGVNKKTTSIPTTGGWQNWTTVSDTVTLAAGTQTVRLSVARGGWNLNWFELVNAGDNQLNSITSPSAITGVANGKPKTAAASGLPASVTLVTNAGNMNADVAWNVEASSYDPSKTSEQTFTVGGTVSLPAGVLNPNNVALTTSISVTVLASPPPQSGVTIEAENYAAMSNVVVESGGSGGSHVGYLDPNDWMDYNVNISTTGTYAVKYTVGVNKTGKVKLLVDGVSQKDTTLSSTGGWNNWATVSDSVTLSKGVHTIRLQVVESGWNLDKFELKLLENTLVSIQTPAAITGVANGTAKTAAALGLPATVVLVIDAGNVNAGVAWNVDASSYDPSQPAQQTFTVSGAVTLPAGVTNPNNVGATTSISVTVLPAPMPQSTLTGLQQVNAGQVYDVTMGLSNVTQSVYQKMYALDLTLHFDPMSLQFESVESLKNGFQVIDQKEAVPGHIRIIAARASENQDVLAEGDSLKFKFTVKSRTLATSATISVGNVVIANAQSNELQVGGSSREIQITVPSTPVDKLLLNTTITNAQAKYDAAVEGNADGLYAMGSKAQLQSAIDAAKAAANASNITQQQVDSAKTALEAAIQVFTSKKITADINGGGVSVGDLALVAGVYGKQQGQSGWNEKADVNHDGKVDITDLAIVARAILQ